MKIRTFSKWSKTSSVCCVLFLSLFTPFAHADCTITVNWTPDTAIDATLQEVWYDPDKNVSGDETAKVTDLAMTETSFMFTIPTAVPADELWVRTRDAATGVADSSKVPVGALNGATVVTITATCQ